MEQNQFDGLEEIEQEENNIPEEKPEKEYVKLLLAEHNRVLNERAFKLVKFGCFEQKEVKEINFENYTKIPGKKLKGIYDLYQNNETLELVFICPLVENNIGDEKEQKNLTPYAYDCIITEHMDEETFMMVSKAAKNNITTAADVLYVIAIVAYLVVAVLGLFCWGYYFFTNVDKYDLAIVIYYASIQSAPFMVSDVLGLFLLVLARIKMIDYKDKQ